MAHAAALCMALSDIFVHFVWQAWRLVTVCCVWNPQFAWPGRHLVMVRRVWNLHSTLHFGHHTFHLRLRTLRAILLYYTLHTPHTVHLALHTLHFLDTPRSTLDTLHSLHSHLQPRDAFRFSSCLLTCQHTCESRVSIRLHGHPVSSVSLFSTVKHVINV